jgi:two-component system, NtrC family, response regulator AtoC
MVRENQSRAESGFGPFGRSTTGGIGANMLGSMNESIARSLSSEASLGAVAVAGVASQDEPVRTAIEIRDPTLAGAPEVVSRVALSPLSILITGETGVGKEVLAHTVHKLSGRTGEFVAINCATLSEALLQSELFGHERGAFTGAFATKRGLFEIANGGTVFLDEIGELSAGLQAKLLRVLETRMYYRVGGVEPLRLDVRFLAATHRNLGDEKASQAFRRDLYFRVNGIGLTILPLRARRESIPTLARELLAQAMKEDSVVPELSAPALDALLAHDWPGNVRELRTVMERAATLCDGSQIQVAHLIIDGVTDRPVSAAHRQPDGGKPPTPWSSSRAGERDRIVAALASCAGNQTHAARKLGISRTTLTHKLNLYRLPRPRKT